MATNSQASEIHRITIQTRGGSFIITDVLSKKSQPTVNERWGVLDAVTADSNVVILKINISEYAATVTATGTPNNSRMSDRRMSTSSHENLDRMTRENVSNEAMVLASCRDLETIPVRLNVDELQVVQGLRTSFQLVIFERVIVMFRAPGRSMVDVFEDLCEDYVIFARSSLLHGVGL